MATVFDSPFIRQRLHRLRHRDFDLDEDQRFGRCDCTSYSYFVLSMVLFSVGTVITVLALGDADGYILSNLGHMWLVGPIFICSGMMVAVKSMLYLRRKSVIQMLLHQRAIIRDMASVQAEQSYSGQVPRTASSATLPPSYDALISSTSAKPQPSSSEPPPPTYDEAMYLIDDGKYNLENKSINSPKEETSEQTNSNHDVSKP
ncbi:jg17467 [Pararge aegeria aegeria]|uniref:Jg17467 protein n=2 Tax=Pararge aegeria TaxID=116150 RepID=A0A8S4RNK7_9NEOP|nr:jg17467 [Pararge aegeria aegeria]